MNVRLLTACVVALVFGCGGGPIEEVDPGAVPSAPSWNEHVRPLLDRYCQSCHSGQTLGGAPHGYDFVSYELVVCEWDELAKVMLEERSMPPGGARRPDARELATLERWASQGFSFEEGSPAPLPMNCDILDDESEDEDEDR